MNLKSKKPRCTQTIYSLYFKSPKIRRILSQGESINSLNYTEDTVTDNSGTIFCNSSWMNHIQIIYTKFYII